MRGFGSGRSASGGWVWERAIASPRLGQSAWWTVDGRVSDFCGNEESWWCWLFRECVHSLSPLNFFSKVGPEADEKDCGAGKLSVSMAGAVVGSPVCLAAAELGDFRGHPLAMHAEVLWLALHRHDREICALLLKRCPAEDQDASGGGRRLLSTRGVHSGQTQHGDSVSCAIASESSDVLPMIAQCSKTTWPQAWPQDCAASPATAAAFSRPHPVCPRARRSDKLSGTRAAAGLLPAGLCAGAPASSFLARPHFSSSPQQPSSSLHDCNPCLWPSAEPGFAQACMPFAPSC